MSKSNKTKHNPKLPKVFRDGPLTECVVCGFLYPRYRHDLIKKTEKGYKCKTCINEDD